MNKNFVLAGVFVLFMTCFSFNVWSHCEIPCGIYGDEARFTGLSEDINTIEKSMNEIINLSKDPKTNINQLVRWVKNKEVHANKISDVITKYFMKQRVKPIPKNSKNEYKDYTNKLALLHQIMVHSMKAKQTADLEHVKEMTNLLDDFHKAYHPDEFK